MKNSSKIAWSVLFAAALAASASAQTLVSQAANFPDGSSQLWALSNRSVSPLNDYASSTSTVPSYNSLYPLGLVQVAAQATAAVRQQRLRDMANSGITGLMPQFFSSAIGTEFMGANTQYLPDAVDGSASGGPILTLSGRQFLIAPYFEPDSIASKLEPTVSNYQTQLGLTGMSGYLAAEATMAHSGVTSPVFFNWGPGALPVADWNAEMTRDGAFWIGMLQTSISQGAGWQNSTENSMSADYGGYYVFDELSNLSANWSDIISLVNGTYPAEPTGIAPKPFAGGVLAGYDRESAEDSGYTDAQATAMYRQSWDNVIASGAHWNVIGSWDDFSERHDVGPSSDWNWTRADLTAWYSRELGSVSTLPSRLSGQVNLYVTSPQRVRVGDPIYCEGLAINDLTSAYTVQLAFYDGTGASMGALSASATAIAASSIGAATTNGQTLSSIPAGGWFYCQASLLNSSGTVVSTVTSAPVLVLPTSASDNRFVLPETYYSPQVDRVLYYSIPAYSAIPNQYSSIGLSLAGSPNDGTSATITAPAAPSGAYSYSEVLQNTYQVQNQFGAFNAFSLPLDFGPNTFIGEIVSTDPWGYYVARVIDSGDHVGYSAPTYVAPPTNLLLNPGFESGLTSWVSATGGDIATQVITNNPSGSPKYSFAIEGISDARQQDNSAVSWTSVLSQTVTGLDSSKTYTLIAWVKSSAGAYNAPISVMQASDGGSIYLTKQITRTGGSEDTQWRMIKISNIAVDATGPTAGTCKVIFRTSVLNNNIGQTPASQYTNASINPTNQFTDFDNVWLYQNPAAPATTAPASAPTGVSATAGDGVVKLSWNAVAGATGYNIYRSPGGEIQSGVVDTSFTDNAAADGTTYIYNVIATNAAGATGHSSAVTVTPSDTPSNVTMDYTVIPAADITPGTGSGGWTITSATTSYNGSTYLDDGATGAAGFKSVRFSPTLAVSGFYTVKVWYPVGAFATIPVDVTSSGAATTVMLNESSSGGGWFTLSNPARSDGRFFFSAGTSGNVLFRNDGITGHAAVSAVQFVFDGFN